MPKLTKTPSEIREDYLRTIKAGLYELGISDPNVSEGSEWFVEAEALSILLSGVFNNIEFTADSLMADTATGEDLDRHLAILGLERRPAGGATGQVTIETSTATFVPTGTELISSTGVRYEVPIGGTFDDGAVITVTSIDVGTQANLAQGSLLTWVGTPAFTKATAEVTRAITGGVDAEDDETARARLLARYRNPPAAGNWQQVAELAEATDPAVQKAFVYPAANGPATLSVAVMGYPSTVSKSRQIDSLKMQSIITPTILGNLPEHIEVNVTTVEDVSVDVALSLSLPLAKGSTSVLSGPGTGGGWLDSTPFPRVNGTTHFYCRVSSYTNSTTFSIDAPTNTAPTVGISKIHWVDRSSWTVKTATITSSTGTGPYAVTIDLPFTGLAVNDFIFPAAENTQTYLDALLEGFKQMGPGEKTDLVALLARAVRKPRPQQAYPQSVDSVLLKYVINSADEVLTATYFYRSIQNPPAQGTTGIVTPSIPSTITDPPKVLVPRRIAFYPEI